MQNTKKRYSTYPPSCAGDVGYLPLSCTDVVGKLFPFNFRLKILFSKRFRHINSQRQILTRWFCFIVWKQLINWVCFEVWKIITGSWQTASTVGFCFTRCLEQWPDSSQNDTSVPAGRGASTPAKWIGSCPCTWCLRVQSTAKRHNYYQGKP